MSNMTKTAALRAAQNAVGRPFGHGTSWGFYSPYSLDNPTGPSTEVRANGYQQAVHRRANRVASLALHMMGVAQQYDSDPIDWIDQMHGPMSAARFVDEALKAIPEDFALGYDDSWAS